MKEHVVLIVHKITNFLHFSLHNKQKKLVILCISRSTYSFIFQDFLMKFWIWAFLLMLGLYKTILRETWIIIFWQITLIFQIGANSLVTNSLTLQVNMAKGNLPLTHIEVPFFCIMFLFYIIITHKCYHS